MRGETRILTPDGRDLSLSQVIICHRDATGQVEFFSTLARDITERTMLERRLSEEKERAEVTLGSIGDAVVRTDAAGVIEYLNPVAEQLLGCRSGDIVGQQISQAIILVHESSRDPVENLALSFQAESIFAACTCDRAPKLPGETVKGENWLRLQRSAGRGLVPSQPRRAPASSGTRSLSAADASGTRASSQSEY